MGKKTKELGLDSMGIQKTMRLKDYLGDGIGGSLIGWLLGAAGYQAAAAAQPASVNTAIFAFSIYIPLVLFIILSILFSKYDLEKTYPKIVEELRLRRAKNSAE